MGQTRRVLSCQDDVRLKRKHHWRTCTRLDSDSEKQAGLAMTVADCTKGLHTRSNGMGTGHCTRAV